MKNIVEVAQLIQACGKIDGRIKLQKMVHILQELGFPFSEEFGYLHHGPYSSDLKREIDQLIEWQLIHEDPEQVIDYCQYTYSAREQLATVLKEINRDNDPAWKEVAIALNKRTSADLESISTIMFLKRRGFDGDRLRERFCQLKPHLQSRFEACCRDADKLKQHFQAA